MEKRNELQHLRTDVTVKSQNEKVDFDEAMVLAGYGRYHVFFMLACGTTVLATGIQNGLISFVVSAARCDLKLTTKEIGLVNSAFLFGGAVSCMIWGAAADTLGRKNIIVYTLIADCIITLFSTLSQSFPVFFIFRFLNGFVMSAPGSLLFSYLGEFHAEKDRARAFCISSLFWNMAWIVLPALAWIIFPLTFSFQVYGLLFNSWRLYVGLHGVVSLIAALLISRFPESPKYLLSVGKSKETLQILRQIFITNTGLSEHEYPVTALVVESSANDNQDVSMSELLSNTWKQLCFLFSPPLLKHAILFTTIIFANIFGYFGFGLWLPELFNRFEAHYKIHPNISVTVCELSGQAQERNETCDNFVDPKVFTNTMLTTAASMIVNLACVYLSTRLERRILPIWLMVVSGLCGCLIYFLRSSIQILMAVCVFTALIGTANIVITAVANDIFPTSVNAMVNSAMGFAGRLGAIMCNLIFGWLFQVSCEVPIFLVGGLVIFGGLLGFIIPKRNAEIPDAEKNQPLKDEKIKV